MIDSLTQVIQFFLHINQHLQVLVQSYGSWVYLILFLIVFCETGLVVTPFLPGDSLLFAAGSIAAIGGMNVHLLAITLVVAAILGDSVNYTIGKYVGPKVFHNKNSKWLNPAYLDHAHQFYEKYGGKAIILARFIPILRTFAPFVAGIGSMNYSKFIFYNITGAIIWVGSLLYLGYWFGSKPLVQNNFTLVILAIIIISILPAVIEFLRSWYSGKKKRQNS